MTSSPINVLFIEHGPGQIDCRFEKRRSSQFLVHLLVPYRAYALR